MFDDNNNPSTPPANLPVEAPDMFADTDKEALPPAPNALDAGLLKKKDASAPAAGDTAPVSAMPMASTPAMYAMKEPVLGKIVLGVVVVVVVGGLGFGGWWLYNNYFSTNGALPTTTQTPGTTDQNTEQVPDTNTVVPVTDVPADNGITADMANDRILFGEPVDTDGDTLDDVREREIGTDPNSDDTDSDSLKDGEEVIIWKTDPVNPDTDGDTFLDGIEVKNGYNPLGPGKLFNVPTSTVSAVVEPATSVPAVAQTTTVKPTTTKK